MTDNQQLAAAVLIAWMFFTAGRQQQRQAIAAPVDVLTDPLAFLSGWNR